MQMWGNVARFIFTCIYIIQINKYNVGNQAEFKVKFGNQTEPKTETGGGGNTSSSSSSSSSCIGTTLISR